MEKPDKKRSGKRPIVVSGPSSIMSASSFSKWMSMAVSPKFLNEERQELLEKMSKDLARNPEFLAMIERMLSEYKDEIYDRSPDNAELRDYGFGWPEGGGTVGLVPAAAAAAALAPPAAALAAAHAPGE